MRVGKEERGKEEGGRRERGREGRGKEGGREEGKREVRLIDTIELHLSNNALPANF